MQVVLFGYPGVIGGASTEAWHTVRIWREGGINVQVIPTWGRERSWKKRLDQIGVQSHLLAREELATFRGLSGSICIGFCNSEFLDIAPTLRKLGCPLVWINCMTWFFEQERHIYDRMGTMDAYVYQSEFQRDLLESELWPFGYQARQGHLIRGAFCFDEWPFQPRNRKPGQPFVVGRLARADPTKWSDQIWSTYGQIRHQPLRARVMGWESKLEWKCGTPPSWAECLPPSAERSQPFMASLDCLVTMNGGARENWPRIGLEAMASGVPVVTENQWGWREMIAHGETGYLANSFEELAHYATHLANHESHRSEMAHAARHRVEQLADPEQLWQRWNTLFRLLS